MKKFKAIMAHVFPASVFRIPEENETTSRVRYDLVKQDEPKQSLQVIPMANDRKKEIEKTAVIFT